VQVFVEPLARQHELLLERADDKTIQATGDGGR
jgi:hypothetical protein